MTASIKVFGRILGFLLLSIFLSGFVGLNNEDFEKLNFKDVEYEDPYFHAILYAKQNGIVEGYSTGEFKAEEEVTRYEFTKILVKAVYTKEEIENCSIEDFNFSDVDAESTNKFGKYICVAKSNSLIKGYSDGLYRGNTLIKSEEAMKIISIGFGIATSAEELSEDRFRVYIEKLANKNAIPSSIENVNSYMKRGETVEIIYRLKNNIDNKDSKDLNSMYTIL